MKYLLLFTISQIFTSVLSLKSLSRTSRSLVTVTLKRYHYTLDNNLVISKKQTLKGSLGKMIIHDKKSNFFTKNEKIVIHFIPLVSIPGLREAEYDRDSETNLAIKNYAMLRKIYELMFDMTNGSPYLTAFYTELDRKNFELYEFEYQPEKGVEINANFFFGKLKSANLTKAKELIKGAMHEKDFNETFKQKVEYLMMHVELLGIADHNDNDIRTITYFFLLPDSYVGIDKELESIFTKINSESPQYLKNKYADVNKNIKEFLKSDLDTLIKVIKETLPKNSKKAPQIIYNYTRLQNEISQIFEKLITSMKKGFTWGELPFIKNAKAADEEKVYEVNTDTNHIEDINSKEVNEHKGKDVGTVGTPEVKVNDTSGLITDHVDSTTTENNDNTDDMDDTTVTEFEDDTEIRGPLDEEIIPKPENNTNNTTHEDEDKAIPQNKTIADLEDEIAIADADPEDDTEDTNEKTIMGRKKNNNNIDDKATHTITVDLDGEVSNTAAGATEHSDSSGVSGDKDIEVITGGLKAENNIQVKNDNTEIRLEKESTYHRVQKLLLKKASRQYSKQLVEGIKSKVKGLHTGTLKEIIYDMIDMKINASEIFQGKIYPSIYKSRKNIKHEKEEKTKIDLGCLIYHIGQDENIFKAQIEQYAYSSIKVGLKSFKAKLKGRLEEMKKYQKQKDKKEVKEKKVKTK
jgi:hypothetical protein